MCGEIKQLIHQNYSKKNISIQLIRVIAMFMIIMDHILACLMFPMQSVIVQVFNSGVFIFLLISGFLFGKRNINNWGKWLKRRLFRICIPLWIFMIIDFIVEAVLWGNFNIKYVLIYAFNLQGILGVNIGGTNLWFLTLIMICYLITPFLQWIKQKSFGKNFWIAAFTIMVALQIILAYTTDIGMVLGHTLSWCVIAIGMYVAGYFAGNRILSDNMGKKRIIILTVFMVIAVSIVFAFHHMYDGQVVYDRIVIFYGMVIVDLWICTVIYKIGLYVKQGWVKKIVDHLDSISYEFYIVHGLIIATLTSKILSQFGAIPYILSTLVLSWVVAILFHGVCDFVCKRCL